jgi:hypothetical protein
VLAPGVNGLSDRAATFAGAAVQPEPVSPELILVDPELARRERARLEERALVDARLDIWALRRAVESVPAPVEEDVRGGLRWREVAAFPRTRILPAALLCSLLANGVFVAELFVRQGRHASAMPAAVRMVTLTEFASTAPSSAPSSSPSAATVTSLQRTQVPATKGSVEREVISLIVAAPARKLPRRFVDEATGLVKNNLQVVCQRQARSFLCAVRLATDKPNAGIHVRYRTNRKGKAIFRWGDYGRR